MIIKKMHSWVSDSSLNTMGGTLPEGTYYYIISYDYFDSNSNNLKNIQKQVTCICFKLKEIIH